MVHHINSLFAGKIIIYCMISTRTHYSETVLIMNREKNKTKESTLLCQREYSVSPITSLKETDFCSTLYFVFFNMDKRLHVAIIVYTPTCDHFHTWHIILDK